MKNLFEFDSDHVGISFFIGAAILILSHGIHIVDPNYHLFFQVCFIIGYSLFMLTPLFKGKKMQEHSIGSIFSVKLDPLSDYPSLMEWPIKNDLPKSENKIIYIPSQS